jgi:hypothetical protein
LAAGKGAPAIKPVAGSVHAVPMEMGEEFCFVSVPVDVET